MKANPILQTQEMARRFNEEEIVQECYARKRELRRLHCPSILESTLSEEELDRLDWLSAEAECRTLPVLPLLPLRH